MKNLIYIFLLFSAFFLSSCEGVVEGLNDDPNNFTDSPSSLLLNHTLLNVVAVAEAEGARNATMFTDQFTGVDRQYGTLNGYSTGAASYDALWEDIYQRGITQAQITKAKAIEAGNTNLEGIATILEAYYFGEAALLFGNIPFSEVNKLDQFTDPTYESQASILQGVVGMLNDGISKAGSTDASNDVFSTSSSYEQVASALKARYQLALKEYGNALTSAGDAGFTNDASGWSIIHGEANFAENLFWQFEVEQRAGYLQVDSSYMHQLLDPTSSVYRGNSKTDETARRDYYTDADGVTLNIGDGFAGKTNNFPVISYAEVELMKAECELEGGSMDNAMTALNNVRARNAAFYGSQYDAYEMSDFASGGMLNTGGTAEETMKREILLEKYCEVIGLPTFQDVNRTKNLINVPIKNSTAPSIPQRFLYPASELSSNDNFPGLIDQFDPTPVNM